MDSGVEAKPILHICTIAGKIGLPDAIFVDRGLVKPGRDIQQIGYAIKLVSQIDVTLRRFVVLMTHHGLSLPQRMMLASFSDS